ncbi:MAG: hypothetical protein U0166_00650 [Acidobacteriota bacterium]
MIARLASVIGALLFIGTLVSFQPAVSMWAWRRFDTYPDLQKVREDAASSKLPWRRLAARLAGAAYDEGLRAAAEGDARRQASGFRAAKRNAFLAYLALHGPLFLGWTGLVAASAAAIRGLRKEAIDIDRRLVRFDLSQVGRVGIVLPEGDLPDVAAACEPVCEMLRLDGEEMEVFELIRRTAIEHGPGSSAVDLELGRLPATKAATFRDALAVRRGVLERLHAHRQAGDGVTQALLELREELREMGEATPLRMRGLRLLAAHPRHPASIGYHGSNPGGLALHTVAVVRRGLEMIRAGIVKGPDRNAFVTTLLFHDVGKLVSYEEREDLFVAVDGLHAQNGAMVLGAMAELWQEHGEEDARRILLSVGQEHDPDGIPLSMRSACEPLLAALQEADGSMAAEEGAVSAELLAEAVNAVVTAFPTIVRDMNINGGKLQSKPDGFFDQEKRALFLLEPRFRDELAACLDPAWRKALAISFRRPGGGRAHPGWLSVADALEKDGALPRSIAIGDRRTEVDHNHLVSVAVGKVIFQGAFPVDLEWLRSRVGKDTFEQLTFRWELSRSFPIVAAARGTDIAAWKELHELMRKGDGSKQQPDAAGRKQKKRKGPKDSKEGDVAAA